MKLRSVMGGVALVAVCSAGSAFAAINASRVANDINFDENKTPVGLDVRLGMGGFTGAAGSETKVGPLLGITAGAQPFRMLGVEAGVEGQRLPFNDGRIAQGEAMWRYNLGVLAKAGPLLVQDKVRPYVGAGAGVSYLNASSGAEGLYSNDVIAEVPLAAGVDYRFSPGLFAGARASYRLLFGDTFANVATNNTDSSGGLFNVSLTAGGRF